MLKRNILKSPQKPGVYFFRSQRGKILYIGKAANIKSRLRSYFVESADLPPSKRALLQETQRITWQVTQSDIEALILEAQLIKKHRPRYNVVLRDDKNYFFVGFTKEMLPRVFLTHQPHTRSVSLKPITNNQQRVIRHGSSVMGAEYIGPFTEGTSIKTTLRLLRRIFPYATHEGFPKRCLEHDLGLCPIPPNLQLITNSSQQTSPHGSSVIGPGFVRMYRHTIRALKEVLNGKRRTLLRRLAREMKAAARSHDFKIAAKRRDEIYGLERVFAHSRVLNSEKTHYLERKDIPPQVRHMLGRKKLIRIEGYDIANLAHGKAATGSMVVFTNGRPDRNEYRQFRIRTVRGANDVAMLQEVLRRRLRNNWTLSDLIMIDGGRAQLNVAHEVLKTLPPEKRPAILSLAKREEEIYLPHLGHPLRLPQEHPFLLLLMHLRDEAHRFARRYHHRLRKLDR